MEEKGAENGVAAMAACYQGFDPAAYLQNNYTPPRADFERKDCVVLWKLACLHRAFTEGKETGDGSSSSTSFQKQLMLNKKLLN